MINASELLNLLKILPQNNAIPEELVGVLGAFVWSDRLHNVELLQDSCKVYFYSDDFNLSQKVVAEKFIRLGLQKYSELKTVSVYMERREKVTTPTAPVPEQKKTVDAKAPSSRKSIPGVKRIVAVASGKGGVGKSTVSVNLAIALSNQGYRVGILDADIYGPSLPMMLGLNQDPQVDSAQKIIPPERFGIKVMSFGFFVPTDSAVIWRGPMVMKALHQFFYDVAWGELDYLVIDLPPGTGDAQLTLVQSLPISGAVIVTTPQNVALLDAVKGIQMFRKTEVPIVGIVENMSTFVCPSCGMESNIFGTGGANSVSQKFEVPVLGCVPLVPEIRAAGDLGEPLTIKQGHPIRMQFATIAEKVVIRLADIQKEQKL